MSFLPTALRSSLPSHYDAHYSVCLEIGVRNGQLLLLGWPRRIDGLLRHRRFPLRLLERRRKEVWVLSWVTCKVFHQEGTILHTAWEGDRVDLEAAIPPTARSASQRGLCGRL